MKGQLEQVNFHQLLGKLSPKYHYLLGFAFVIGGMLLIIIARQLGWPPPIIADDIKLLRVNTALPTPGETIQLRQSIQPRHDGFTEVELLVARANQESSNGRLTIQVLDPEGQIVAREDYSSDSLSHNQPVSLTFPPQTRSAGKVYTLLVSGSLGNNVTIWGYDLDQLESVSLTVVGAETNARELRLVTRYQLTTIATLGEIQRLVLENLGFVILAIVYLALPGCLLLAILRKRMPAMDPAAWLGLMIAIGISSWPVIWLWFPILGLRWRSWSLALFLVLGWILVIILYLVPRLRSRLEHRAKVDSTDRPKHNSLNELGREKIVRFHWQHGLLMLIVFAGFAVRLLAVRDLEYPPWVDSSRHALITAVMANSGTWLQDYEPFLPIDHFLYHAGFHSLSAGLFQLSDVALPRLLLILGQFLNGLVPLTVYAGAYLVTRRRNTGLFAAFLVAFPFFFPAYYTTWGRMTQLTAVLTLPIVLALTWRISKGVRAWQQSWWILATLIGGLFLIHVRVFLIYLVYLALVLLLSRGRHLRSLFLVGVAALLMVLPRIIDLWRDIEPGSVTGSIDNYNAFPNGYINFGWERTFLYLGVGALFLGIVAGLRRRRWATYLLTLVAWIAVVALLLSGERLNLPESVLININSAYIILFLPLSWILAIAVGRLWSWSIHQSIIFRFLFGMLVGALITVTTIYGLRQQATILNPETLLVREGDSAAIAWIQANIEQPAKVAINSWKWLGNTWTGTDGGAWLVPITAIESSTPPVDYIYSTNLMQEVITFNNHASQVEDWSDSSAVEWLREQDITHIFVGAKGGFFDPSQLNSNPTLDQIYGVDGAYVFAVQ